MAKRIIGHFIALGGGNEIGKSMYVLIFPLLKVICIIDCGVHFRRKSKDKDNVILPEKLEEFVNWIDPTYTIFVCFSHAHNDHIGAAVKLYKLLKERGLKAIYFTTEPTKNLIEVAGEDNIGIRERNQLTPHYDEKTLYELLDKEIQVVRSSDWIDLGNGLRFRFEPSGHIRGAASILIETPYGNFLYSGDIQFYDTTLVRGASRKFPDKVRWLAMDSTNGNLVLPDPESEIQRMEKDALEIVRGGGHVLGPGFSLGRGQDVCIRLGRDFGRPPAFNLFAGGLIEKTSDACHHSHWESDLPLNGAVDELGFHLEKENVRWVTGREIPERLKEKPGIFIVTPGMIQAGLSLEIFLRIAEDPKGAIFFFGFQAEESNGRSILNLESGKELSLNLPDGTKKLIKILAQIKRYSISGHADGPQSTSWVQNMEQYGGEPINLAILVHGHRRGQYELRQKLLALPNRPKKVLVGVNNKPIPLYA